MSYASGRFPQLTKLGDMKQVFADTAKLRGMLSEKPRRLHSSLSYTEEGSEYFAELCHQPEYYPAHVERDLLYRESQNIIRRTQPDQIIDLGCGSMEKSQVLLHEAVKNKRDVNFIPCDIDSNIVRTGTWQLCYFYGQDVRFTPVHAGFEDCIQWAPRPAGPRLFTFLGITYGNLTEDERAHLLQQIHQNMDENDAFLMSVDLIKDRHIMERAYKDSAGYIRESMLQSLVNLNDYYGAEFDLKKFDHEARYEEDRNAVVEYLVSRANQAVRIRDLDLTLELEEGEGIETEFSEKFVLEDLVRNLDRFGFTPAQVYNNVDIKYALLLLRRRAHTLIGP